MKTKPKKSKKNYRHEYLKYFNTEYKRDLMRALELLLAFLLLWSVSYFNLPGKFLTIIGMVIVFTWSARYGLLIYLVGIIVFEVFIFSLTKRINIDFQTDVISSFTIISGLVIAIIGEMLNKRIRVLENENKRLMLDQEKLNENIGTLRTIISQLQMRVYSEGEGLIVLLEKLRELETLDVDEMITRAVDIIASFFDLENLQFYRLEGRFLRFITGIGHKNLPNSFKLDDSKVIERAIIDGHATLTEIALKEELEKFEPWFAVSIGKREDTFGILEVENIDPEKYSEVLIRYIESIAGFLNANIKIVMEQESLMRQKYLKEDGTWEEEYYIQKKNVFEKRKLKFGIPYQELTIRYNKAIDNDVVSEFRKSDVIVKHELGNSVMLKVLLPVCDESGKMKLIERLRGKYEITEY